MAAKVDLQPGWVKVDGSSRTCCSRCGQLVAVAWCWFDRPALYTWAFCEACVEQLLEEEA